MDFLVGGLLCFVFMLFILLVNYFTPNNSHPSILDRALNRVLGWMIEMIWKVLYFYIETNRNAYYGMNFPLAFFWLASHVSIFYSIWTFSPRPYNYLTLFALIPVSLLLSAVTAHLKNKNEVG